MDYKITTINEKDEEFSKFIHAKIREYNDDISSYHRAVRKQEGVQAVNIIVANENDEWVGGMAGEIYWGWLEINDFWLHQDYRKQGIGTKLLKEAEEIALSKGCDKVFLTTFEFQARTFYERNGYVVTGKLEDYPPGSAFYWMTKKL